MAKLSAHGPEIARFFDPRRHCLTSLRADGVRLVKSVWSGGWKVGGRVKGGCSVEVWRDSWQMRINELPTWAREVKRLPSQCELEEWASDGVCETPTGDRVEPDGHGPDGAPSWLLALGMV